MITLSRQKICLVVITTAVLLMIPIILWLTGFQWQLSSHYDVLDTFLFIITETGSVIVYAALTCILLTFFLMGYLKEKRWLLLILSLMFIQLGTQVIKTVVKMTYKEPRPYTTYLVEHKVNLDEFYSLPRSDRKLVVTEAVKDNDVMPQSLKKHWASETGYSFPSGHTAFAVAWLVSFILLLPMNRKRDWIVCSIMFVWTALMSISRIRFGMHFPIDVFVSTLYVPLFCLLSAKLFHYSKLTKLYECIDLWQNQWVTLVKGKLNVVISSISSKKAR